MADTSYEKHRVHTEFSAEDKSFERTVNHMTGSLGKWQKATDDTTKHVERRLKDSSKAQTNHFKAIAKNVAIGATAIGGLTLVYKRFISQTRAGAVIRTIGQRFVGMAKAATGASTAMGVANVTANKLWQTFVSFSAATVWGGIFGAGAIAMIHRATRAAEQYQVKLKEVNFVLGSTAAQARMVDQTIIQLGIDTPFSMAESAQAVYYLASSLGDVNKTLAATPAMMDAALAGNMGLAEGSNLLIQTLNMFNEVNGKTRWELAESSRRQADVLTTMQRISPFVMQEFGPAFQGASRAISAYNQDLEATLAVMGALKQTNPMNPVMAGFGIDMMIRALSMNKKAYERITGQSFLTSEGKNRQLMDMIGAIAGKLGLTAANIATRGQAKEIQKQLREIFPSEYYLAPFMNVIKVGLGRVREWYSELKNESKGAAESFRDDMINTVSGWKKQLQGSMDTAWTLLGRTFQPFQQAMYKGMTKGVNVVIRMLQLPLVKYFVAATLAVTAFGGAVAAIGPLVSMLQVKFAGMMGRIGAIGVATGAGKGIGMLGALVGRGGIVGGIAGMGRTGLGWVSTLFGTGKFENSIKSLLPLMIRFVGTFGVLFVSLTALSKIFPSFGTLLSGVLKRITITWSAFTDFLKKGFKAFAEGFKEVYKGLTGTDRIIDNSAEALKRWQKTVEDFFNSPGFQGFMDIMRGIGKVFGYIAGALGARGTGMLVGILAAVPAIAMIVNLMATMGRMGWILLGYFKSFGRPLWGVVKVMKVILFGQKSQLSASRQQLQTEQVRAGLWKKIMHYAGVFKSSLMGRLPPMATSILQALKAGALIVHNAIVRAFGKGAVATGLGGVGGTATAATMAKATSGVAKGVKVGAGVAGTAATAGAMTGKIGAATGALGRVWAFVSKFGIQIMIISTALSYVASKWDNIVEKFKKYIVAIGLGIAALVTVIGGFYTGGATWMATPKLIMGALAAGAVGSAAATKFSPKKEYQSAYGDIGIPNMQEGGIVVRPGLVNVTHPYEKIVPPAKVAPLSSGAGGGNTYHINMPVNFNGNVVGDLPEDFLRTLQEKLANVLDEDFTYSYQ